MNNSLALALFGLTLATSTALAAPSKADQAAAVVADYVVILDKLTVAVDTAGKDCPKLASQLDGVGKATAPQRTRINEAKDKAKADAELTTELKKAFKAMEAKIDPTKLRSIRANCGSDKAVMAALKTAVPRL